MAGTSFTLATLRTEFANQIGRSDLSDARLTDFINAGQKYLDDRADLAQADSNAEYALTSGSYDVLVSNVEEFDSVRLKDSDDMLSLPLTRMSWEDFSNLYSDIADESVGTPLHWCIVPTASTTLEGFYLRVGPPTSEDVTLVIHGKIKSAKLSEDSDTNYWTEQYPMLLLAAAEMFLYSMLYRNKEAANEKAAFIEQQLQGLNWQAALYDDEGLTELQG